MICELISDKQGSALKKLGCVFWTTRPFVMYVDYTLDSVIDYLRKKHSVVIYNSMEPFVDPRTKKILYRYSVKFCNIRDGWNGRQHIGQSKLTSNIYSAKRQAIWLAIRWLKKKKHDKEKLQTRPNRHSKRKVISTNETR